MFVSDHSNFIYMNVLFYYPLKVQAIIFLAFSFKLYMELKGASVVSVQAIYSKIWRQQNKWVTFFS